VGGAGSGPVSVIHKERKLEKGSQEGKAPDQHRGVSPFLITGKGKNCPTLKKKEGKESRSIKRDFGEYPGNKTKGNMGETMEKEISRVGGATVGITLKIKEPRGG